MKEDWVKIYFPTTGQEATVHRSSLSVHLANGWVDTSPTASKKKASKRDSEDASISASESDNLSDDPVTE